MDSKRFDALTRGLGAQRSRRDALKTFAAGLIGLGIARDAGAQVTVERANCGQLCNGDDQCNAGLICRRVGGSDICVRIADSLRTCGRNTDCTLNYEVCRNSRECVNAVVCTVCADNANCANNQICRNGRCGECTRDTQCPAQEVCRNGRCERDRNACRNNRDCPGNKECRNGRCKKRRRR